MGPRIGWIKNKYIDTKSLILIAAISLVINFTIFYFFQSYNFISNLIIISSLFLIFNSIKNFLLSTKKNFFFNIPSFLSHLGFGFLMFFIVLNHNLSKEFDLNIKVGETKKLENFEINFQNLNIENKKKIMTLL